MVGLKPAEFFDMSFRQYTHYMMGQIDRRKKDDYDKILFARANAEWSNGFYKNFDPAKMMREIYEYEYSKMEERERSIEKRNDMFRKEMDVIKLFEQGRGV